MKILLPVLFAFLLAGCGAASDPDNASGQFAYTLYRGGAVDASVRMPFATFETEGERAEWNKDNCEKVAGLMNEAQRQELHPVKFWCEKGKPEKSK